MIFLLYNSFGLFALKSQSWTDLSGSLLTFVSLMTLNLLFDFAAPMFVINSQGDDLEAFPLIYLEPFDDIEFFALRP